MMFEILIFLSLLIIKRFHLIAVFRAERHNSNSFEVARNRHQQFIEFTHRVWMLLDVLN